MIEKCFKRNKCNNFGKIKKQGLNKYYINGIKFQQSFKILYVLYLGFVFLNFLFSGPKFYVVDHIVRSKFLLFKYRCTT